MAYHSPAYAEENKKEIIMFVPDTEWPPYLINDPQHPGGGVLLDIFNSIATPMGYTVIVKQLPNKRGWFLLDKGEVHVHAKAKEWVTDPDLYLWSDPFMSSEDVLLFQASSPIVFKNIASLDGLRIAAITDFIYPGLEDSFKAGKVERVDVASPYAMLELLNRGRVDAALVNYHETLWLFRNHPELKPERFRLDPRPVDGANYRYVFTRKGNWQPFIEEFNKHLKRMKHNGRLQAILSKYR